MTTKGLLCFDIDGTLTHQLDFIHPQIEKMLEDLAADGWTIAMITGRSFGFAEKMILPHFKFPYYFAVQNGSDLLHMPEKRPIHRFYLSSAVLPILDKAYGDIPEDYMIYSGMDTGDFCYFRRERFSKEGLDYLGELEKLSNAPWQAVHFPFETESTFPLIKCFGTEEAMWRIKKNLEAEKGLEISVIKDPISRDHYLALITSRDANKGSVLKFLKKHVQAPIAIAAGDQENDRKMLEAADISIAIENAPEDLCKMADIVAKRPSELGIIDALQEAIKLATR